MHPAPAVASCECAAQPHWRRLASVSVAAVCPATSEPTNVLAVIPAVVATIKPVGGPNAPVIAATPTGSAPAAA